MAKAKKIKIELYQGTGKNPAFPVNKQYRFDAYDSDTGVLVEEKYIRKLTKQEIIASQTPGAKPTTSGKGTGGKSGKDDGGES